MIPLLALAATAAAHWPGAAQADQQIRAQRAAFNRAIAKGDIPAIGAVLADNALLVGGDFSKVTAGKRAQVALWSQDLKDKSRGIYVRMPDRIQLSPVLPMAMETGRWHGVDSKAAKDWASGVYSAKWRRFGSTWKVESETYMTTACGGDWCPKGPLTPLTNGRFAAEKDVSGSPELHRIESAEDRLQALALIQLDGRATTHSPVAGRYRTNCLFRSALIDAPARWASTFE